MAAAASGLWEKQTFHVRLDTSGGGLLGLSLCEDGVTVETVDTHGLVRIWNEQHHRERILPGQRILSVNGHRGPQNVIDELLQFQVLDLEIAPPVCQDREEDQANPGGSNGSLLQRLELEEARRETAISELTSFVKQALSEQQSRMEELISVTAKQATERAFLAMTEHVSDALRAQESRLADWRQNLDDQSLRLEAGQRRLSDAMVDVAKAVSDLAADVTALQGSQRPAAQHQGLRHTPRELDESQATIAGPASCEAPPLASRGWQRLQLPRARASSGGTSTLSAEEDTLPPEGLASMVAAVADATSSCAAAQAVVQVEGLATRRPTSPVLSPSSSQQQLVQHPSGSCRSPSPQLAASSSAPVISAFLPQQQQQVPSMPRVHASQVMRPSYGQQQHMRSQGTLPTHRRPGGSPPPASSRGTGAGIVITAAAPAAPGRGAMQPMKPGVMPPGWLPPGNQLIHVGSAGKLVVDGGLAFQVPGSPGRAPHPGTAQRVLSPPRSPAAPLGPPAAMMRTSV